MNLLFRDVDEARAEKCRPDVFNVYILGCAHSPPLLLKTSAAEKWRGRGGGRRQALNAKRYIVRARQPWHL